MCFPLSSSSSWPCGCRAASAISSSRLSRRGRITITRTIGRRCPMVAIHPFRALRYNLDVVGDLSRVIAPPYDVIGPQEQDALYAASPYNIVRLILGTTSPADTEQDNRYTRARQEFE